MNRTTTLKTKMAHQHALQMSALKAHLGGKHASIVAHLKKIHAKEMEDCDCDDVVATTVTPVPTKQATTVAPTQASTQSPVITSVAPPQASTQSPGVTTAPTREVPLASTTVLTRVAPTQTA
jgi:hypothetical protein